MKDSSSKRKGPKPTTASNPKPLSKASTDLTAGSSTWIRIDRPLSLPSYVKEAIEKLDKAGYVAYLVGGSVRDFILSRPTKDHDLATDATPDVLVKIFPQSINVGKAFGVIKIPVAAGELLEIASFREDQGYTDFRHPKSVRFAGPEEDARRRDFTVNGLYYDTKQKKILDLVGGVADIEAKVIRAIGDPNLRFQEDALRLLRAVRFSSQLGFEIEKATAEAIQRKASNIRNISGERIRDELSYMLLGPQPKKAFHLLSELGLLAFVLPECAAMKGVPESPIYQAMSQEKSDVWNHTLKALDFVSKNRPIRSLALSWATLLHQIGKPHVLAQNGGKNFNGYEVKGADIAKKMMTRLRLSSADLQSIQLIIKEHLRFKDVFQMREATLQRWVREPYFSDLLSLHQADVYCSDGNLAYYEFAKSRCEEAKASRDPIRLIDGDDLIQLGMEPSPRFSMILRVVEDLALEKKLKTKEEALEFVVKYFV